MDRQANAAGATQTAFDEMEKSNSRKMERLKVTFQNISIAIGNALLPIASAIADKLQIVARLPSRNSPRGCRRWPASALAVAAAAGPLLIIFGKLSTPSPRSRSPSAGGLLMGLAPALPIVAALAGAGFLLYKNWDKVAPILTTVKDGRRPVVRRPVRRASTGDPWRRTPKIVDTGLPPPGPAAFEAAGMTARQLFDVLFKGDFKGGPSPRTPDHPRGLQDPGRRLQAWPTSSRRTSCPSWRRSPASSRTTRSPSSSAWGSPSPS